MHFLTIDSEQLKVTDDGFILSPCVLSKNCAVVCSNPEKAAELDPVAVSLRNKGGTIARGTADWYHTRLEGTTTLPHALLALFTASLTTAERAKLNLTGNYRLSTGDITLLRDQGLLIQKTPDKPPRIHPDAKRVIRASIQVRVDTSGSETVTLALRKPYVET